MRSVRATRFIALAAVLVAGGAACGSSERVSEAAAGAKRLPAPPIEALDAPAPEYALEAGMIVPLEGVEFDECIVTGPDGKSKKDDPASCRAAFEAHEARTIAPGSTPRLRAALRVSAGEVLWIEYRRRDGDECVLAYFGPEKTAPELVCASDPEPLDLSSDGFPGVHDRMLVIGTVPREADALRLQLANGSFVRYAVEGPLVGFDPSRRVFMAESSRPFVRAEAMRGGDVIAEQLECHRTDLECPPF